MTRARVRALAAPVAAGGAAVVALAGGAALGVTVCPFALLSGHACPGCGLTRAVAALLTGDVGRSWRLHPLAGLIALQLAAAWLWWVGCRLGLRWAPPDPPRWLTPVLGLTAVALVAVWGVRWSAGALPPV